ncbi:hypothetical protein [Sphingomonas prati]|uniref:hypothetical protein n=1 Tax=Sphingomonas prati TaxID=1843237 RepID=UPI0012F6D066|nr:hypothetical protein [Sphingomonas prati]
MLLLWAAAANAQDRPASPVAFDAAKAWSSFEKLFHEEYGYFDRAGVDGDAVLAAFADRATAAKAPRSKKDQIDTLQLVSHNFGPPHFIVGPFDADDWAIVPTSSDLFGTYDGIEFRIREVRRSGDALVKGVRPGRTVLRIEGQTPRAATEAITGRPFGALSPIQIGFAFNVALAGHRKRIRSLDLTDGQRRRTFMLAATSDQANRVRTGPLLDVERQGTFGVIPYEARVLGPTRKFTEYVAPYGTRYTGKVYVAGGHWTGSMGEGLMIGFDAIGDTTSGTDHAHLLGALSNETIEGSAAKVDIGNEQLFTVTGLPREDYRPQLYLVQAERDEDHDPVLTGIDRSVDSRN